nr:reverse transcriptase domain-containing protein [Tanacetum cinerariifolium]
MKKLAWQDGMGQGVLSSRSKFFPHSKTTNLRNEIIRFQQRFDESFYEAWEQFNDLLRACPRYGFSELHQLNTFYNALNVNDQDSLNSAAGTSSSTLSISSDIAELKDMVKALLLDKKNQSPAPTPCTTPAPVKAVESSCIQGQSMQNQCQNIQNQNQNLQNQMATLTKMMSKLISANTASSSGSETLPGNTVTNPKEDLKCITTRSGVAYPGPKTPSPSKQGTKVTKDQVQTPNSQISKPIGIAKDVSFKVGVFHFPTDFVVVDFEPDPRVPLILGRCFLKTSRALIDVHKGELTLHIRNEAITYNLDQTVRYSANYNQMTENKIDVVESACEEYSQKVLGFSNVTDSGISTPQNDPIVSVTSPTLTLFRDSDFLLFEEADAFLGFEEEVGLEV